MFFSYKDVIGRFGVLEHLEWEFKMLKTSLYSTDMAHPGEAFYLGYAENHHYLGSQHSGLSSKILLNIVGQGAITSECSTHIEVFHHYWFIHISKVAA